MRCNHRLNEWVRRRRLHVKTSDYGFVGWVEIELVKLEYVPISIVLTYPG